MQEQNNQKLIKNISDSDQDVIKAPKKHVPDENRLSEPKAKSAFEYKLPDKCFNCGRPATAFCPYHNMVLCKLHRTAWHYEDTC